MFELFNSSAKLEHAFAPVYEFPGKSLPEFIEGIAGVGNDNDNSFSGNSYFSRPFWVIRPRLFCNGSGRAKLRLSRGYGFNLPGGVNPREFMESSKLTV